MSSDIWIGVDLAPESCNISHSHRKINRLIFRIWVEKHPSVTRSLLKDICVLVASTVRCMVASPSYSYVSGPGLVAAPRIDKPTLVTQASLCRRGVGRSLPKTADFAGGGWVSIQTGCSVFAYVNIYWNCDIFRSVVNSLWQIKCEQGFICWAIGATGSNRVCVNPT